MDIEGYVMIQIIHPSGQVKESFLGSDLKNISNYCTKLFKLENDQNQILDFCPNKKRVKNLAVKLQLFEATRLASFFVDTLPSHFSGSSTSRMADVLHTKKNDPELIFAFPKK